MQSAPETSTFWPSGKLIQQAGAVRRVVDFAKPFGSSIAVVDEHVAQNSEVETGLEALRPATTYRYSGKEPSIREVDRVAGECARGSVIVTIGGGSTIDMAKAVAIRAATSEPLERFEGAEKIDFSPVPIIAAPTTAGTGSEVSGSCVLESADGSRKLSIRSHRLVPVIALLDPSLLATTPRPIIAASGIDAFAHAIEAFFSTRASVITDALALGALRLISTNLPAYYRNPATTQAAAAMAAAASMAGMAFNSARVGLAHAIASAIGPQVHLPHGVCVSLGLPYAVKLNAAVIGGDRLALLSQALGVASRGDDGPAAIERRVRDLIAEVELPQTASAANRDFTIDDATMNAVLHSGRLDTNPAPVSESLLRDILAELKG